MKKDRRMLVSIVWIVLGVGLMIACKAAGLDEYWSGMGAAFVFVGVLQLLRWGRYHHNEEYREKVDVETKDERNRFLAARAWAWAGYLFVIIAAAASIGLRIAGQDLLGMAAGYALCLIVVLYWVSYLILKKKY